MSRDDTGAIIGQAIREALPGADRSTVEIVTAVVGLLAAVAYADRTITVEEAQHLEAELARIHGLSADKIKAIAKVLQKHALRLSTAYTPRFTRTLREELPEETRAEVLDALLGMAASDGSITHDEIANLRNITTAMGLSQAHYNQLQQKFRDKLV
jgi:uncharacterized tellurite resistance protein B-like protein